MTVDGKDKHGGYVPAERLFVPAVAMPGIVNIDDAFIEKVLRVGGMLREMGNVEDAFACYEHFIGALRRFTMVPLGVAVADENAARQAGMAMQARAAGEFIEP
jgi:hypothetical protein